MCIADRDARKSVRRYIAVLIFLMLALNVGSVNPRTAPSGVLRLTGTIPLDRIKGRIDHMTATPDGRWLFVAALGANRVLKIDTKAGTIIAATKLRAPQGVSVVTKSGKLAAASGGSGSLHFYTINLAPLSVVHELEDADNLRYDPDANLLYAAYGDGGLAVIEPEMAVQTARLPLDGHPESFQLEEHGTRIFINVPSADEVEVFDRARRVLLNEWKLKDGAGNFPMALDEAHMRLFIATRNPPRMLVLESEAGKEIAMLSACGDADDLFYDAASRLIYLSGGQGCVSVFRQTDTVTYDRVGTVNTFPGARTSLLVPGAHRYYVAVPRRGTQRAEILVFETP
jgi:hypothetical protein